MAFPVSPTNGQITEINGINYQFVSADSAWVRIPVSANIVLGNLTANNITAIANVTAGNVYTTYGLFWSGNGVAFSSGGGGSLTYTAGSAPPVSGNVVGDQWYNTVTDALYEYLDNGVSKYWVDIQTSIIAANAVVTIPELIQANLGAFQLYANANIGTLFLGNVSTNANLGTAITNISNLVTQSNANTAAYLTTYSGNVSAGNLNVGNYSNVYIATGSLVNRSALTISGNVYGRGGVGYLDAVQLTNNYSAATNPNKYIRVGPTGGLEIINSAYTTTLLSLSDAGVLNVSGSYQVAGKQAVNGPAFRAYIAGSQTISSGSQQKVTFGSETFDTNNNFASSTFTPTVEGYYQLNATVRISGPSSTGECMLIIWKNGNEYARGTNESGTEQGASFYSMQVSDLVYANGTTDYFEIYIQQTSGSNRDTTAGQYISYFSGAMVRGA